MRIVFASLLLCLFSIQLEAKNAVSLNEAVNQAKTEGRVLSAKTVNGMHEVKVLTSSGTVKTINRKAVNGQVNTEQTRPDYYNKGGRSMRDRKQNPAIPNHFSSQQKVMKIPPRTINPKLIPREIKPKKNDNKKDK